MMRKLFGRPEAAWLISAVIACVLLAATLLLPLWKMELVAPQYPAGLVMKAYGYKFADDPNSYYDDVREINGLNHYIGMKPIEEVTEMKLFIPGVAATILGTLIVSFVAWKRKWFRALIVTGFWFMPLFFVVDLQYWLYHYGHTMDEHAALNTGAFTPKVWGTTKVWNFHSETGFEIGFYLMIAAAMVISFLPLVIRRVQRRLPTREPSRQSAAATPQAAQRA
ncbi:MAG TPA: cytochrome C [Dehalococcoidia bacterium]|nr:cytochrome C [Dehalococcoidia bacterium]